jgi:predicted nuclease with TOPRIM domain
LKDKITAKEEEIINTQEAGNDVSDLKAELQKLEEQLKYAELEVAEMEIKLKELEERRKDFYNSGERIHWNINVYESPETLNFWFDFLDTSGILSQYNVKNIGSRSKSLNDTNVTSIYFRETPSVIFTENIVNED